MPRKRKVVNVDNIQEVWRGFGPMLGYTWKVLKKLQEDDFSPGAKYECLEQSTGNPSGRVVEIVVWDLKKYAMKISPRTLSVDVFDKMTLADLLELDT